MAWVRGIHVLVKKHWVIHYYCGGFMDWDVVVLGWVFMYFLYLFPLFAPNFKKRISILLFDLDLISFSCLLLPSASLFEFSLSVE